MSLTCVCGYWNVKNKHGNKFDKWFKKTLKVNCPYVFFGDKESIEKIKKFRGDFPTTYIELNLDDFYMNKYRKELQKTVHNSHCPSVEVNMIWNEKVFLMQKAKNLNPYNSEFFKWIDAGLCIYRSVEPPKTTFPNKKKMKNIPKDKFIYAQSNGYNKQQVGVNNYYHHISGNYMMHKDFIDSFISLYKTYLKKLLRYKNIWTDQVILTHIFKDNHKLFHRFSCGYGSLTKNLY